MATAARAMPESVQRPCSMSGVDLLLSVFARNGMKERMGEPGLISDELTKKWSKYSVNPCLFS
jgi:hypothetical protein